jgi:hypothetical protein
MSLAVLFGLFHGLILLPVVLSIIGPDELPGLLSHHEKSENIAVDTEEISKDNKNKRVSGEKSDLKAN